MEDDVLQNWNHLRGEVDSRWPALTEDDLHRVEGRRSGLVNLLEAHYGLSRGRAEREVNALVLDFETKLRKAS